MRFRAAWGTCNTTGAVCCLLKTFSVLEMRYVLYMWFGSLVDQDIGLDSRLDSREFDSRPTRLILGWVTVFGRANTSVFHQAIRANSASYPQWDWK